MPCKTDEAITSTMRLHDQTAQRRRELELWRVCIADWTLLRCWNAKCQAGIVIRPPEEMAKAHGLAETTVYQGAETGSTRMLYELANALLAERENHHAAPDAPPIVPYESIAKDLDAMVRQHVRIADDFATLTVASLNNMSPYAQRRRIQAREDVADSARSLALTTVRW